MPVGRCEANTVFSLGNAHILGTRYCANEADHVLFSIARKICYFLFPNWIGNQVDCGDVFTELKKQGIK